ncbi:unnamed protein product [Darwinula stevensoni]|uniref:Uncharacterized protein n=1 Tax=Darwinula stevensoni TaxID=69355 RepID=A0A7R8X7I9_9CRUS|nr:unnamed protein product [Darwinula stevensoni]CAG0880552.1 unnamed protein product [Darwinula stevensoni]
MDTRRCLESTYAGRRCGMVPLMHQVVTLGTVIMLVSLVYDTYRQPSASPEPDAEDSDVRKRSDARKHNHHPSTTIITEKLRQVEQPCMQIEWRNPVALSRQDWKRVVPDMTSDRFSLRSPPWEVERMNERTSTCIYRFICELHSTDDILKYGGTGLTFLKFFKSNPVLERPFSGSYNYYFAAHMGHLMRGGSGGGCPFLFPSCPLRGEQVAKVLSSVESLRTF